MLYDQLIVDRLTPIVMQEDPTLTGVTDTLQAAADEVV